VNRILSIFVVIALILSFSSCRFSDDDNILRYDIGSQPKTLDPQASNDEAGRLVLSHVFEGLLSKNSDGELVNACAKKYEVSKDGLTYTFTLHDDIFWSNGAKLTADDFLFAFTRLFRPETRASDVSGFLCIKNAKEIYNGERSVDDLGVYTLNETTLVIELDYNDSSFLQALATVPASPCNREFFEKTKGKYGADYKNVIYNNRFQINDWKENSYITLRPNNDYRDQSAIKSDGINFYTSANLNSKDRFFDETTDIVELSFNDIKSLDQSKFKTIPLSCTTWVLGFNQRNELFQNQKLRTALLLCAQQIDVKPDADIFTTAKSMIPLALEAEYDSPALKSPHPPFELYKSALEELGIAKLPTVKIIAPDYYDFKLYLTYLQKAWMNELGVAINFEVLDDSAFNSALEKGNFDIIILPITADSNAMLGVFNSFTSYSSNNYFSYKNAEYDALAAQASQQTSSQAQQSLFYELEKTLIESAVLTPVFHEKEYLGLNKRVQGIVINPLGPELDFSFAYKK